MWLLRWEWLQDSAVGDVGQRFQHVHEPVAVVGTIAADGGGSGIAGSSKGHEGSDEAGSVDAHGVLRLGEDRCGWYGWSLILGGFNRISEAQGLVAVEMRGVQKYKETMRVSRTRSLASKRPAVGEELNSSWARDDEENNLELRHRANRGWFLAPLLRSYQATRSTPLWTELAGIMGCAVCGWSQLARRMPDRTDPCGWICRA